MRRFTSLDGNREGTSSRGKLLKILLATSASLLIGLGVPSRGAVHQHINAGAHGSNPGATLYFVNGDRFAAESDFVVQLEKVDTGPQAGSFRGSLTFTALAATLDYGGPAFDHAALGAHLELVLESVQGPVGGRVGFWEGEGENEGSVLTFDVPVGITNSSSHFALSETPGGPEDDPYGHIHGRVFSATLPGFYQIGWRIIDTSSNGSGGGPLHPPSELFLMNFEAGVTIAHLEVSAGEARVRFAAASGFSYQLEDRAGLSSDEVWSARGDPVLGDDHVHTVVLQETSEMRFFRLRRSAM